MARQLKPYIDRIRQTMERYDIYSERNDMLIESVAMMMRDRDAAYESMRGEGPILTQVGSQKQSKVDIHPAMKVIESKEKAIIRGLYYLGIGNTKKDIQPMDPEQLKEFLII